MSENMQNILIDLGVLSFLMFLFYLWQRNRIIKRAEQEQNRRDTDEQ